MDVRNAGTVLIEQIQALTALAIQPGSRVLVVGLDQDELTLPGIEVWRFPCDVAGGRIPYLPPDDEWVIEKLEALRDNGARYLLITPDGFWWLEHYRRFTWHLENHSRVIAGLDNVGLLVDLCPPDRVRRPSLTLNGPALSSEEEAFPSGTLWFQCNVCGRPNRQVATGLTREGASCAGCGSSARWRAVVHTLSVELFQRSLPLTEFPQRPDVVGIGLSDWEGYARPLGERLSYRNTFYHRQPYLDITRPSPDLEGTCDFLLSSDVFEHVVPPVSRAFEHARLLLKPNGVLILTVPYGRHGETIEHFPNLHRYEVIEQDGRWVLKNMTRDGLLETHEPLVFHGGPGETLEMRRFTELSLLRQLTHAGFTRVHIYHRPVPDHGIWWNADDSYPIAARVE